MLFQLFINKRYKDELYRLSNLDQLTGLANRQYYENFMSQIGKMANRNDIPIAVILCDIDDFKKYNDTYGHLIGDECLIAVSNAIQKKVVRETDLVARFGGEEIIIVLTNTTIEFAINKAKSICLEIEMLAIPHSQTTSNSKHVTISCGVSWEILNQKSNIINLVDRADKGLYKAKKKGKNQAYLM